MRDVRMNLGLVIFTLLPLMAGVMETRASFGHLAQAPWPPHAMFHLMFGLAALWAVYGLIIVLTWGPLRRGERWAWYSIGVAALGLYGSALLYDAITGGGLRNQQGIVGSGVVLWRALWVLLILYAIALALTWRHTGVSTDAAQGSDGPAV